MEDNGIISTDFLVMIVTATLVGALAHTLSIKQDYRQYPSHPNGLLIHWTSVKKVNTK